MYRNPMTPKLLAMGLTMGLATLLPAVGHTQSTDEATAGNPTASSQSPQATDQQSTRDDQPASQNQQTESTQSRTDADQKQAAKEADSDTPSADDANLPRTASSRALLMLLGLAGLGAAIGVRTLRRA